MSKLIALFFASMAFISIMIKVLLDSIHVGTTDPIYVLKISTFGALVFGVIGFYLGRIFEEGKQSIDSGEKIIKMRDKELLIDDILIYDIGVKHKKDKETQSDDNSPK